jgi:hypothetical protein
MKKKLGLFLVMVINTIERMINFFKKDAYIFVDHIYESIDGETKKVKNSFSIYICQYNKCQSLFSRIDWSEAERVIKILEESKGKVLLQMNLGLGSRSYLLIPKWAKKKLIQQLREELNK